MAMIEQDYRQKGDGESFVALRPGSKPGRFFFACNFTIASLISYDIFPYLRVRRLSWEPLRERGAFRASQIVTLL